MDVNAELFPARANERMTVAMASTLNLDGSPDDGQYNADPGPSLMDSFDYVMHGRIFSLEYVGQNNQQVEVQVSFGGLLLKVRGEQAQLSALEADIKVFILLRAGGSDSNGHSAMEM
eukprot:CAMPEP_0114432536 /NCGR_PEP_ID=MMETSP0103-20121206/11207_1 /TAXON_ID=37642 ORGANISM="Paraphysomonas imperforata, Strain PA2" /NCGR_SAMPLE_ID=MMETSP0103 /ASSEMBLY_ACC=CAM_ASM_000201 /LENGTH=116 /DNA_ID=CAMNT_0001602217 /DNA_START=102 /DNA_END=452 /DNA_ORIENTATION=+